MPRGLLRIGKKGVSETQLQLLAQAMADHSGPSHGVPIDALQALHELASDTDIREGREPIHPQWGDVLDSVRPEFVAEYFPRSTVQALERIRELLTSLDPSIRALDPSSMSLAFLLGAGASKPSPSNIPTVKELLPQLLEKARRLDRDDLNRLADFCDEQSIDNIEDLLTAAQIATFCSRNGIVLQLLNYLLYRIPDEDRFGSGSLPRTPVRRRGPGRADISSVAFLQDTLQVLFGLLASTMLPAKPNEAHLSIARHVENSLNGPGIVTTNYDCCMDIALREQGRGFNYGINPGPSGSPDDDQLLIKLHGSLNWYYCETCQQVTIVEIDQLIHHYASESLPYPVIAVCSRCGGQRRGLLVPPLAMKFDVAPPLTPLLDLANQQFEKADLVVVVGFSFADADVYISRMLSKSMQVKAEQKLLIVDPEIEVTERVRRKFSGSIPSFDTSRIVHLVGDASDVLPKFLNSHFVKGHKGSTDSDSKPARRRRSNRSDISLSHEAGEP